MTSPRSAVTAAAPLLAASAGVAQAQSAGSVVATGRPRSRPDVKSGDLTAPSLAGHRPTSSSPTPSPPPASPTSWDRPDRARPTAGRRLQARHRRRRRHRRHGQDRRGEGSCCHVAGAVPLRRCAGEDPAVRGRRPHPCQVLQGSQHAGCRLLTGGTPANPTHAVDRVEAGAPTWWSGRWHRLAPRLCSKPATKTFWKTRATPSTGQTLDAARPAVGESGRGLALLTTAAGPPLAHVHQGVRSRHRVDSCARRGRRAERQGVDMVSAVSWLWSSLPDAVKQRRWRVPTNVSRQTACWSSRPRPAARSRLTRPKCCSAFAKPCGRGQSFRARASPPGPRWVEAAAPAGQGRGRR